MDDIRTTCYMSRVKAVAGAIGMPPESSADDVLRAVLVRITQPESVVHLSDAQRLAAIHTLSTPKEDHA